MQEPLINGGFAQFNFKDFGTGVNKHEKMRKTVDAL
eukprot:XP_001705423.1 Hypothetical protein GL50803_27235 [Giardia lamblia ATCC 50803]